MYISNGCMQHGIISVVQLVTAIYTPQTLMSHWSRMTDKWHSATQTVMLPTISQLAHHLVSLASTTKTITHGED